MNLTLLEQYFPIAQAIWANTNTRAAILLFALAGVFMFATAGMGKKVTTTQRTRDFAEAVNRPTNTSLFRRLWWHLKPPTDLMKIDGLWIDRTRKLHCLWVAPTGGGKSASVATIRMDGKRPVLGVTPDLSDPLIAAIERLGGVRWTAGKSGAIDFLKGTPPEVGERLTEVFRSGGQGVWKRYARMATTEVVRGIDADGVPRSLKLIGERLAIAIKSDKDMKTACAGWVARFLDLAEQFGDSIGPDGLDIADLLNRGISVLLDNDSFDHAALGGDVVALGLAEGKRCASLVPTGFRLIFEEAGQLGERIDLAEPFFRAGRRRNISVDVLTQAESDLNDGINSNIATRIYFAQELKSLQKTAADRLGLPYSDLDPANLKDFFAYIAHGRIRRLVHFPKPPKARSYAQPLKTDPTHLIQPDPAVRRMVIEEVAAPFVETYPSLPPPSLKAQEIIDQLDRSGECWLWLGKKDRDGYGIIHMNGNWKRVHRVLYELAYGAIPIGPNGKALDLDHRRTCARHCGNPEHLEPVTRRVNVQRMHRTRGHQTAAD